jgi:alpha-beta hydrolase superfamily lysophospholipase
MPASPQFPRLPSQWLENAGNDNGIFYRHWQNPNSKTGKSLFLIHGFGEHSGRYEHFPFYLNNVVDSVFAFDLPGHGKSAGQAGHIDKFSQMIDCSLKMFEIAKAQNSNKWSWLGHSMGGLIVLKTLTKNENLEIVKSVVSAPLLDLSAPVNPVKKALGLLIEPIFPRLPLKNDIDEGVVSHDPDVVAAYAKDPLNHQVITPRMFKEMSAAMLETKNWNGNFNYSIEFLIPLADPLVSWKSTYDFAIKLKVATGKVKDIQTFPNFFHEGFNELGKDLYFNTIVDWLK